MVNKIYTWFLTALIFFSALAFATKGLPILFSSVFKFVGGVFGVVLVNVIIMALLSRRKTITIAKDGILRNLAQIKIVKYLYLAIFWTIQLGLVSYFFFVNGGSWTILLMILTSVLSWAFLTADKLKKI